MAQGPLSRIRRSHLSARQSSEYLDALGRFGIQIHEVYRRDSMND